MMLASIVLPRPTSSARMARPPMSRSTRWATSLWWGSALMALGSRVISRSKPGTSAMRSASRRSSYQARSARGSLRASTNRSKERSATARAGSGGVSGFGAMGVGIRREGRQKRSVPVLEDWLWHCAFPCIAYVTLLVAALVLRRDPPQCLLGIGATALLLLFIGIHNAWDAVTYIATQQPQHPEGPPDRR